MDYSQDNYQWMQYVETPCHKNAPVKLDRILAQRIQAFMRAKRIKTTKPETVSQ